MIPKQPIRWCNGGSGFIGAWQEQRNKENMDTGHDDDDKGGGWRSKCSAARKFADGAVSLSIDPFSARKIVERHQ
jgi:hypothetical protein